MGGEHDKFHCIRSPKIINKKGNVSPPKVKPKLIKQCTEVCVPCSDVSNELPLHILNP